MKILVYACSLFIGSAWAADCDLDEVVGYELVASKTINGRIEICAANNVSELG